ncbi:hypothetical protein Avbf_01949 [Armadillidium vulgare]|nr:hypothetical protein Avbf_01949 [Armadillidium vulgare]
MKDESPGKICKHIPILSRSESVTAFQKRFEQLTHILKLANEVLSPYLLITLLYYAIELCMYLYELVIILLFRENLGLKHQIIIVMLFCILFLYLLLTTVEGAQFLQDQGEDCLDELSKCSYECDINIHNYTSSI